MDKRFQVFISSTFQDLQKERRLAMEAVLALNQMPSGMELFPASDEDSWNLIRKVIDDSDYYVLIVGGMYGSCDDATGLSYTEREYDYARASGKYVIAVLHENPLELPTGLTERDPKKEKALKAFRKKVDNNHFRTTWKESEQVKSQVLQALAIAILQSPAVGWIRADKVPNDSSLAEQLVLRERVAELERINAELLRKPPPDLQHLAQGDDLYEFEVNVRLRKWDPRSGNIERTSHVVLKMSWDDIFERLAPSMLSSAHVQQIASHFDRMIEAELLSDLRRKGELVEFKFVLMDAKEHDFHTCLLQFVSLGLAEELPGMGAGMWRLTPYGKDYLLRIAAVERVAGRESTATA